MSIPLSQFLQIAGPSIFDRGHDYFRNGHVISFEEIVPGKYDAVVQGSEDYIVNLTVIDGSLEEYSCTCPYDYGSVCKHIVAAVLYLQKETAVSTDSEKKSRKVNKPAAKKKTVAEQIDDLLESVTPDDLKGFIREKCFADISFRRQIMSGLVYKSAAESPEKYRELVIGILRNSKGRDNFIKWSTVRSVGKAVNTLLDTALNHVNSGNWLSACYICFPVAEEMVKALDYADDSDGDIGENINYAFEILSQISESEISEIRRRGHWSDIDEIAKIYIAEQWWERLLDIVSGIRHLPAISHYEKYLSDKYPSELADIYEKAVKEYLKRAQYRNHYREACRYIQRMKSLGGRKRTDELILNLRKEYPKKKALLEEIMRI